MDQPQSPDPLEIAWASGLFEGEGSIHANRIKSRVYMLLNLSSNDEDVVRRFARAVGCGKVYGPYYEADPKAKPRWSWHAKNKADANHAVALLEPYLCTRRRAKLEAVRVEVAAQPPPQTGLGTRLSPQRRAELSEGMKRHWARRRLEAAP